MAHDSWPWGFIVAGDADTAKFEVGETEVHDGYWTPQKGEPAWNLANTEEGK